MIYDGRASITNVAWAMLDASYGYVPCTEQVADVAVYAIGHGPCVHAHRVNNRADQHFGCSSKLGALPILEHGPHGLEGTAQYGNIYGYFQRAQPNQQPPVLAVPATQHIQSAAQQVPAATATSYTTTWASYSTTMNNLTGNSTNAPAMAVEELAKLFPDIAARVPEQKAEAYFPLLTPAHLANLPQGRAIVKLGSAILPLLLLEMRKKTIQGYVAIHIYNKIEAKTSQFRVDAKDAVNVCMLDRHATKLLAINNIRYAPASASKTKKAKK